MTIWNNQTSKKEVILQIIKLTNKIIKEFSYFYPERQNNNLRYLEKNEFRERSQIKSTTINA